MLFHLILIKISFSDRNNNKNYTARIEEKIDNFLLKIKIENKDINQKGRTLIIVDKNSECIGKKNANYSGDLDPAISSTTKEQSNSDDLETQANKSMKSELAL